MRRAGLAIACWAVALGCGGKAELDVGRRSSSVPTPPPGTRPDAGLTEPIRPPEPGPERGEPEPPPFEDPGCPPVSTLPDIEDCDPLAVPSGCPLGESCFPFVSYPTGPCEVERFGTVCGLAGTGTQGDSCISEACAGDHICVSTGRGTQCVRLCGFASGAPNVCSPGLLCLPIDIEGFGGCL